MKINKYVFKRREIKYKLNYSQYCLVLDNIIDRLIQDEYGEVTIQSLYYDTDNWLLIRNSIEHPFFKEKLRLRSYGLANAKKDVFLEIKRKCDHVVYKRRISLKESDVPLIFENKKEDSTQIEKEIQYFNQFYGKNLKPRILLLYDRTAWLDEKSDLRITFDRNVRYRTERLDLHSGLDGVHIFEDGEVMMEIKTESPYPMWLVELLNGMKIYKTSFSKYGEAYKRVVKNYNSGGVK